MGNLVSFKVITTKHMLQFWSVQLLFLLAHKTWDGVVMKPSLSFIFLLASHVHIRQSQFVYEDADFFRAVFCPLLLGVLLDMAIGFFSPLMFTMHFVVCAASATHRISSFNFFKRRVRLKLDLPKDDWTAFERHDLLPQSLSSLNHDWNKPG